MSKEETPYILKEGDNVVIEIECGGERGFDVYVTKNGEPIARLDTRDLSTVKMMLNKIIYDFELTSSPP